MNNKVAVFGQRRAGVYLLSEIYNPVDDVSPVQNINKVIPAIGSLVVDDTVGNHNTLYVVYSVDAITHRSTLVNANILDTTDGINMAVSHGNEGFMLFYSDIEHPYRLHYKTTQPWDANKVYYTKDEDNNFIEYTGMGFEDNVDYYERRYCYEVAVDGRLNVYTNNASQFIVYKTTAMTSDSNTYMGVDKKTEIMSWFYKDDNGEYIESNSIPLDAYPNPVTTEFGEILHHTTYHPKTFYSPFELKQGEKYLLVVLDNDNKLVAQVVLEGQPMMGLETLHQQHRIITKFNITANQYNLNTNKCYLIRGQNPSELTFYGEVVYSDGTSESQIAIDNKQLFVYGLEDINTSVVGSKYPVLFKYFTSSLEQVNVSQASDIARNYSIGPTRRYIYKTIEVEIIEGNVGKVSKIAPIFTYCNNNTGYRIIPLVYFSNMADPVISYDEDSVSGFNNSNVSRAQTVTLKYTTSLTGSTDRYTATTQYQVVMQNSVSSDDVWYYYRDRFNADLIYYGKNPKPRLIPVAGQSNTYKIYSTIGGTATTEKEWFLKNYYYNACPPAPYGHTTTIVPTHFQIRAVNPTAYLDGGNEVTTIPVVTTGPISIDDYFNSVNRNIITTIGLDNRVNADIRQPSTAIIEFLVLESQTSTSYKVIYGVSVDVIPSAEEEPAADTTPPYVTITSINPIGKTRGPVIVKAQFIDDDSGIFQRLYKIGLTGTWEAYLATGVSVSDNNTVYFKAQDNAGNWSAEPHVSADITNIDKTEPILELTVSGSGEYRTLEAAVTNKDGYNVTIKYSTDPNAPTSGSYANDYTGPITVYNNATYYFIANDGIGNTGKAYKVVDGIVHAIYTPIISGNPANTEMTRGPVLIEIDYIDERVIHNKWYYKTVTRVTNLQDSSIEWVPYTGRFNVNDNCYIYAKCANDYGDVAYADEYHVTNIDLVPPSVLSVSQDITSLTNQSVKVTPVYSNDTNTKQYSLDAEEWSPLPNTGYVTMELNGYVYFRGIDAVGNVSDVYTHQVTNIDKEWPDPPTVTRSTSDLTNQSVRLTATPRDNSDRIIYAWDDSWDAEWSDYPSDGVVVDENCHVYFRSVDQAGNNSRTVTVFVNNIDKVPPDKPEASADVTEITAGPVTVSATFPDDAAKKEYSITNGSTWVDYPAGGVIISENTTVQFKATDEAGNESEIEEYVVDNIYTGTMSPPTITPSTEDPTNSNVSISITYGENAVTRLYYIYDPDVINGNYLEDDSLWSDYDPEDPPSIIVEKSGISIYAKCYDVLGHQGFYQYTVNNIDKTDPTITTRSDPEQDTYTNSNVKVYATFSDNVAVANRYYKIGQNGTEAEYSNYVTATENCTVYFRAVDTAGNESTREFTVSNIDRVKPTLVSITPSTTNPTNQSVTLTAIFNDNTGIDFVQYRIGTSGTFNKVEGSDTASVTVEENCKVQFRACDMAGNLCDVVEYEVTNISTAKPATPTFSQSTDSPTNDDVDVTITFGSTSVSYEISNDGQNWTPVIPTNNQYVVTVTTNNTIIYAHSTDAYGNTSNNGSHQVTNIDRTPPDAPIPSANVTTPTNGNVIVSAEFSSDTVTKQYRTSTTGSWLPYPTEGVTVTDNNTTVYFRAVDAAGNDSTGSYLVNNIDRVRPPKPTPAADITSPTRSDVTVTATFTGADVVTKQYSFDETTWDTYPAGGVVMTNNGTVYFRSIDAAGNESLTAYYEVTNIDRVAPIKPEASANTTAPTNGRVIVSASFSSDSASKKYSLDNSVWQDYPTGGVEMANNGHVYFKAIDAAGNESLIEDYEVTNIDTTAPDIRIVGDNTTPVGSTTVSAYTYNETCTMYYAINSTSNYQSYTANTVLNVTSNATYYFKAVDAAGNTDEKSITFENIFNSAPAAPTVTLMPPATNGLTNTDVVIHVEYGSVPTKEYRIGSTGTWQNYTGDITVQDNTSAPYQFRGTNSYGIESDITSVSINYIDKVAPTLTLSEDIDSSYEFATLTATATDTNTVTVYWGLTDDAITNEYSGPFVIEENGDYYFKAVDAAGNETVRSITVEDIENEGGVDDPVVPDDWD